jgi:hypothetical protein
MDEASGSRADSHTNGLTLTDNNTVGSTTGVGAGQTAADFIEANSEYLSRSHAGSTALDVGVGDYTVAIWVNPDVETTKNIWTYGFTASRSGLNIRTSGAGRIQVDVRDNASNRLNTLSNAGASWTFGAWNLIIVKLDRTNDIIVAKINNATVTSWFQGVDISAIGTIDHGSTDPFHIGATGFSPPDAVFDGQIGPVGVWSRLTTDEEDTTLYNSGTAALLYDDL